jgi:SAM-dependent methyltransferase
MGPPVGKGLKILREEGVAEFTRQTYKYTRNQLGLNPSEGESSHTYQLSRKDGVEARWEMISEHIDETTAVLDIGCSTGLMTAKCADAGAFAIGVDHHQETIRLTRNHHEQRDNLHFINSDIDDGIIQRLPKFDVILLFSVWHYWHRRQGEESAKATLELLGKKTDTLFFENVGHPKRLGPEAAFEPFDETSAVNYNMKLLTDVFDDQSVEYLGSAPRKEGAKGERYVFAVRQE